MNEIISDAIKEYGFYESRRTSEPALLSLVSFISGFKQSSIRVDKLYPRKANEARCNSLSANHGVGRFPPHTDFAYRSLPPRYIALFCPIIRLGATTLYNGEKLRKAVPRIGTFRVSAGGKPYYASFSNSSPYGNFYRYNSDFMVPLDTDASKFANVVEQAEPDHCVEWDKTSWVLIDNWRMLHGRQAIQGISGWLWRLALEVK